MRVLILGSGGHAKVVADIVLNAGHSVTGFLDDDQELVGRRVLGIPILGPIHTYDVHSADRLVLGIGSNRVRRSIVEQLGDAARHLWISAIHPRATVAATVSIGNGTVVMAGAVINPDTAVGSHSIINTGATVDHDCDVADFVHVAPGCHVAGGVKVGEGSLLGVGSSVTPNRTIGTWATVGAGAVVIENVPSGETVVGVPARRLAR